MDRTANVEGGHSKISRIYWVLALLSLLDLLLVVSSDTYRTAMGDVELDQMSSLLVRLSPGLFNGSLCAFVAARSSQSGGMRTALICGASGFYAIQGLLGIVPFAGYLVALASPIAPLYMLVVHLFGTNGVYMGMALMMTLSVLSVWMIIVTLRTTRRISRE
jgi:hypothetical protein